MNLSTETYVPFLPTPILAIDHVWPQRYFTVCPLPEGDAIQTDRGSIIVVSSVPLDSSSSPRA
jgi:hypothetical protein